jgi:hypothetical protein
MPRPARRPIGRCAHGGPLVNALPRTPFCSNAMFREWQRHPVEEVGLLPGFLPALYADRNDRNIHRIDQATHDGGAAHAGHGN